MLPDRAGTPLEGLQPVDELTPQQANMLEHKTCEKEEAAKRDLYVQTLCHPCLTEETEGTMQQ